MGVSQAFELDPLSGFRWCGECEVTIDELLSGRKQAPESQSSKAKRLIESALANGPVLANDMFQMAEEQGISTKTLNRTKDALGVISIKRQDRWYWEIPIEVDYVQHEEGTQDGQDGHAPAVTTLTILPVQEASA